MRQAEPNPTRSASVLMPTFQGIEFLERVFDALAGQRTSFPWDVVLIDSGSTDGTWEHVLERRADFPVPIAAHSIHPLEFDHGDTRNLLAARSTGDLLVYLTQDAIPSAPDWLELLAANFADPRVGAAYCRNVARADARPLTRIFCRSDPGYAAERVETTLPDPETYAALDAEQRRVLYNFNDVASAVRRELWERYPFPRTTMGEDVLLGRALIEAGYTIVYDAASTVDHSHDYGPEKMRWRGEVDGRFNAEWLDRVCVAEEGDIETLVRRLVEDDMRALASRGASPAECARLRGEAEELRTASVRGLYEGSQATRRYPRSAMRDRADVHVLYVTSGFPPEGGGEAETYAFELALEMRRRGHRVTVLTRCPARDDEPDFSLHHDALDGLEVLRMTHRLAHKSVAESYLQPGVEDVFRQVLTDRRPDVVHFQGLHHMSAGLVRIAKERELPTVVSCHDYWGLCPRVLMVRADGQLCPHNMGGGCRACLKGGSSARIEQLARMDDVARASGVAGAVGSLVARGLGARGDNYEQLRARERIVPGAYAIADLRIAASRFLREKHVATGSFEPQAFVYSDCGVRDDLEPLPKTRAPGAGVRFGFVGSIVPQEGCELLIRAMARIAGTDAVLRFHGRFNLENDPYHIRLEAARPANVEFVGHVDRAELSVAYAGIDVLVAPAEWYESSPASVRQALRTRTPVLTTDAGACAELVRDGVDGLHFRYGDEDDLVRKLRRFTQEPDLIGRLSGDGSPIRSGDGRPIKTLSENAAEMEFRYRALCCIDRSFVADRPLLDVSGAEATVSGDATRQGADWIFLHPGSKARFSLEGVAGGPVSIELEQRVLASEPKSRLAGRVLIDGVEVGRFERAPRVSRDRALRQSFETELPPGARSLVVEPDPGPGTPRAELRVCRLRVVALRPERPSLESRPPARIPGPGELVERLAVEPGPAVSDRYLPRVAVVIPNLNGRDILGDCLASIERLDYDRERLEVLVVDNGSSDGSLDLLREEFGWVKRVANPRNLGFAAACNAGARAADAPGALAFLNNDMRFEPDFLRELVAPLVRGECQATTAKVLSWDGTTIDGAGTGSTLLGIAVQPCYGEPPRPEHDVPRKTLFGGGGAMAIDPAAFTGAGGFDEEFFAYYEDLDLGWRMWVLGHSVHYVPSAVCYHHHSHTSSRFPPETVRLVQIRNSLLACVKNYDDANFARILPVLFPLATQRAHIKSGLDDLPFRIQDAAHGPDSNGAAAEPDPGAEISRIAAADLIGINDLSSRWEHWMGRRRAIQSRRGRPDREILRLFLEPLLCVEADPRYRSLQDGLFALYGLDELVRGIWDE